jgi:hypothetical protein
MAEKEKFFLVVMTDEVETPIHILESDSAEGLAKQIEEHVLRAKTEGHAFAFKGERIEIGTPRPVCSLKIDGKDVIIGESSDSFEASGWFSPLQQAVKPAASEEG